MTSESKAYFSEVADQWDSIRSGYFTESVRLAAIAKAYLRPEMVVADVGAGTGFMAAGLAPLVERVYVIDGSPEMLEIARKNLKDHQNLVFEEAEGNSLPLPDASVDAVFANMYLHHCPEPLAAVREMARLLRPGGRLVITDLDAHNHEWMKAEMADYWLGFERLQIHAWFEEAGLVNVILDGTGQTCSSERQGAPEASQDTPVDDRQAVIDVFVAVGTSRVSGAQQAVREHYGELALSSASCCSSSQAEGSSCCGGGELIALEDVTGETSFLQAGYSPLDRATAPAEAADFSLGCGNPVAIAGLQPGETVLDIGSGGGLDSFLSAQKVGPSGHVIGVDMTPAMLERARRSAQKAGLTNVEFRKGQAEALPVEDATVDVILSNCVINLCEDKGRVFREAQRALRSGGRLEISDVVTDGAFPADFRAKPENWGACVFGALPEGEYIDLISQAGFKDIRVRRSTAAEVVKGVNIYSITVSARKR
jgi:ubiquinone/menaquinone biosynthesis C-methylase UbiE